MISLSLKRICDHPKFFKLSIITFWTKFGNKLSCRLRLQLYLIFFLLNVNFDKCTIGLHFLLYFPYLQNLKKIKDQ